MPKPIDLTEGYVDLRPDNRADALAVDADFWPELIAGRRSLSDGRLLCAFAFEKDWDSWERHPAGDEMVILLTGHAEMVMEVEGAEQRMILDKPGQCCFVPRNAWHTAKVREPARMLFITPGQGTEHKLL